MMEATENVLEEITSWTRIILSDEQLSDISVKVIGNSENGFLGDIIFISVEGVTEDGSMKNYDLALKCSKKSKTLRENHPVRDTFLNEISVYHKVLPYYVQFQEDREVADPFTSVPTCYGCITGEDMEIIFLENLKSNGYENWPSTQPFTRKHVDLTVTEYAKFHAISLALQDQQPNKFQDLSKSVSDVYKKFSKPEDLNILFDESVELLRGDMEANLLDRWKNFKEQMNYIFGDMPENLTGLKVILHGDCWNNFMFTHKNGDRNWPEKVAFLDWQQSKFSSPILDLSSFLFSSISEEDLDNLEEILTTYYESFRNQLYQLGCKAPDVLYSFSQFLDDWKNYSRYGVLMASLVIRMVCTEKDDAADAADIIQSGQLYGNRIFGKNIDKDIYKARIKPVVEYAIKHDLI